MGTVKREKTLSEKQLYMWSCDLLLKIRINFRDVTTRSQGAWRAPTPLPPPPAFGSTELPGFDI